MTPPRGWPWLTPELLARTRELLAEDPRRGRTFFARQFNLSLPTTERLLQVVRGKLPMPPMDGPDPAPQPDLSKPNHAKILQLLRTARSIEELADGMNQAPRTVRAELATLEAEGYPLKESGGTYWLDRTPAPAETRIELDAPPRGSETIRFGFVSDSHLGSNKQQLSMLVKDYQRFADAGITTVLHTGDLLDGVGVYRGQPSEAFLHTYDDQIAYCLDHYPQMPGIRTLIISGNHDLAGLKTSGTDPLKRITRERADLQYLGPYSATISIGGLSIYLLHPQGGPSYASSYRLQKLAESFVGGQKPHIALVGHWHRRVFITERNIHLLLTGAYCAQTEFERRHMLAPVLGGGIFEVATQAESDFHAVTPTMFTHFVPVENDR